MNKLVLSALAATVAVGTTSASESDWAGLDAELNSLTTALDSHGGPSVSGYLEAGYNTDTEVWGTTRNRVALSGDNGGYGYNVSLQGSEAADAYVTFTMGGMGWTMGTFMKPGTGADAEAENARVFSTREFGDLGARSNGLMTGGNMDALGYSIFVGNNNDFAARVTYDVMSGDGVNLSVAYSMDDAAATESSAIEADVSSGPFGIHVTMATDDVAGTDPMCITASYDVNDAWGIAIRQTDDDTGADETMDWALTYTDGGARWTIESLDDGNDAITIGCLVGF
jgi:hypothetical protein